MKKVTKAGETCNSCGVCSVCCWLLPVIILVIALVPGWLTTMWGKWVVVIAAALLLLKKWCPCHKKSK